MSTYKLALQAISEMGGPDAPTWLEWERRWPQWKDCAEAWEIAVDALRARGSKEQ